MRSSVEARQRGQGGFDMMGLSCGQYFRPRTTLDCKTDQEHVRSSWLDPGLLVLGGDSVRDGSDTVVGSGGRGGRLPTNLTLALGSTNSW